MHVPPDTILHVPAKFSILATNKTQVIQSKVFTVYLTGQLSGSANIDSMTINTEIVNKFATTTVTTDMSNKNYQLEEGIFRFMLPEFAMISNFTITDQETGQVYESRVIPAVDVSEKEDKTVYPTPPPRQIFNTPAPVFLPRKFEIVNTTAAPLKTLAYQNSIEVEIEQPKIQLKLMNQNVVSDRMGSVFMQEIIKSHVSEEDLKIKVKSSGQYFLVKVNLNPGKKIRVKFVYEELLHMHRGSFRYNLAWLEWFNSIPVKTFELSIKDRHEINSLDILPKNELIATRSKSIYSDRKSVKIWFDLDTKFDELNWLGLDYTLEQKKPCDLESDGQHFIQRCRKISSAEQNVNVVFIIDSSDSMYGHKLEQTKSAFKSMISELRSGDYFNIVQFSNDAETLYPTTTFEANDYNKLKAMQFVDGIQPGGATNFYAALAKGLL